MRSVLLPVKRLTHAKTRLDVGGLRSAFAIAFAKDTIAAVSQCADIAMILVLTDDHIVRQSLSVLPDVSVTHTPRGLNEALHTGAAAIRAAAPRSDIAVVMADLPALTPAEFSTACSRAAEFESSYVPDRDKLGTTALFASSSRLHPAFGPNSHRAHTQAGHAALDVDDCPGLVRDVDLTEHLEAVAQLGVGRATAEVLARYFEDLRIGATAC
ncbi:2-phospho-L-lactate guanylyltransferase [Antrihabitans stalactiti]|uniref:2-phospho-L-lactate guanylyltransferase n=1 Tax=Antrihabitans stalactiti TaxID=2584121 RepID=A0A848KPK4_9NOCA|nr:2-phospho-L-lactate guanylyltransferase [Antrihabitans stalactiti]NMN97537.1 2-phospho-L-lactate guanylyltransferase [Antrihabitans stalactiti]